MSAGVLPETHVQEHCLGHEMSDKDCACCSDMLAMNGGCTTLCSAVIAIAASSLNFVPAQGDEHSRLIVQGAAGPTYLPLNPPPIS